jgi:hypothetical protein
VVVAFGLAACTGAPQGGTNVNGEYKAMGLAEEEGLLRTWHSSSVGSLRNSRISNSYKRLLLVNIAQAYESSLKTKAECFPLLLAEAKIVEVSAASGSSLKATDLPLLNSERWYVRACAVTDEWQVFVNSEGPFAKLVRK